MPKQLHILMILTMCGIGLGIGVNAASAQEELAILLASDGEDEDRLGVSAAVSGPYVVLGADGDDDGGDSAGAAYVFYYNGSGWVEQQKLIANDAAAGDQFGRSVATNGDYTLVGAPRADVVGDDSGVVYVFERDGTNWNQVDKFYPADIAAWDEFGWSLNLDGDRAVIGADCQDTSTGAAYIYEFDGFSWLETAKLLPDDAESSMYFGRSVGVSGDYVIVGADGNKNPGGAAYVFYRNEGGPDNWGQQSKLTPSISQERDRYGRAVAIDGDYAVVGAEYNTAYLTGPGDAYVYERSGSTWGNEYKLASSDGEHRDYFGCAVAVIRNYVLVGAYGESELGNAAGAAYFFESDGSSWTEVAKLLASDGDEYDWFGYSAALSDDYLICGARADDDPGAGYVFSYPCDCPHCESSSNDCMADVLPNNSDGVWTPAVDGDCRVNLFDLAQLLAHYGCTDCTHEDGDIWPENGDCRWQDGVDGDGYVGLSDLATLLAQYGDDCN